MVTRILKLSMQGFKSFNKRIAIPFLPGFNVIVGPNGSGKTNLLDAISFVLGRSSGKSMRAERLNELIFNGGKNKKPAEYAMVSIWFDNTKRAFPLDENEIVIQRRINKKGVSVFKINGRTVTRSQLLDILAQARIYPDGHNIVRQGDVTRVLEMNPVERRGLIDEISGIAEYDEKKEQANKKLEEVEKKLKEVEIILSERYEVLRKLEEEKEIALQYQKLQEELEVLEASLTWQYLKTGKSKLEEVEKQIDEVKKRIESLQSEIEKIEKEIELKTREHDELYNTILELAKVSDVTREIEEIKSKIARNKDRIESNRREIERIDRMIEKLKAIKQNRMGYDKGVKAILSLKNPGVYGTVADVIKVPSKYRKAIEVAIGSHAQDIIVENDRLAANLIEYLRKNKLGRASFIPLNKIKRRDLKDRRLLDFPGVVGLASEVIDYDPKFSNAVSFVLGSTLIVEDIQTAREIGIGKVRMVTLDGDLVETSGLMTGGYYESNQGILDTTEQEIKDYEIAKEELVEEINFFELEIEQLTKKLEELKSIEEEETKKVLGIREKKEQLEAEIVKLKELRREKFEEKVNLQSDLSALQIEKAKLEAETEKYEFELEEIKFPKEKLVEAEPHVIEGMIRDVKRKLSGLGLVNMKAIEEYDKFKQEFDELRSKYDQIVKEKRAVIEMIERIEARKKEVFYECLQKVNSYFNEIFHELTGGSASLELEDPNDLESGLLIKANPAGKRMINIDALSGGEKTLTALAFLFALQMYRPAPFYVLDEVDAALDKANSEKVAKLIQKLSKKAQFIVITHNDAVIKAADRVYGVSMVDGESKILAIELPQIKAG